jgi:cell division protein FtsB
MRNIWTWLSRLVVCLIVAAVLVGTGLKYLPLLNANQAHRAENQRRRDRLAAREVQYHQLQASIKSLQNDPRAVERVARDVLSYARPGEVVVTLESSLR